MEIQWASQMERPDRRPCGTLDQWNKLFEPDSKKQEPSELLQPLWAGEPLENAPKPAGNHFQTTAQRMFQPNVEPSSRAQVPDEVRNPYFRYANDKLIFEGVFTEDMSNVETLFSKGSNRRRKVHITYYLEDNSISVREPATTNSGMTQGLLLRRTRHLMKWQNLIIGTNIVLNRREYQITACDEKTRSFYRREGVTQGVHEEDQDELSKMIASKAVAIKAPERLEVRREKLVAGKRWDQNDRKVLRFQGYCDQDGKEKVYYTLYYYLVDNTVEVKEMHQQNDGYGTNSSAMALLSRQQLPLDWKVDEGATHASAAFRWDARDSGEARNKKLAARQYYTPEGLRVGGTVNVYARPIVLYDCDSFTRNWYIQELGKMAAQPVALAGAAKPLMELQSGHSRPGAGAGSSARTSGFMY
jgi:hypothetical protein